MGKAHTPGGARRSRPPPLGATQRFGGSPAGTTMGATQRFGGTPAGTTNRRPATAVDYQQQPSSPPGRRPGSSNPARGTPRSARWPGTSHAANSQDPAPSRGQLPHHPDPLTSDVKRRGVPRPDPVNSGFPPVETGAGGVWGALCSGFRPGRWGPPAALIRRSGQDG